MVAESWRTNHSRYFLEGRICKNCNVYYFPIQRHCSECFSGEMEKYIFSDKGKVVEFTRIEESSAGFELMVPYYYGIVELDGGKIKISTQIIAPNEQNLEVNLPVQMTFRLLKRSTEQDILLYGFKAEVIQN